VILGEVPGRLAGEEDLSASGYRNDFQIVPHDTKLALGILFEKAKHLLSFLRIFQFSRYSTETKTNLGAAINPSKYRAHDITVFRCQI
jgi:hypothetical protein